MTARPISKSVDSAETRLERAMEVFRKSHDRVTAAIAALDEAMAPSLETMDELAHLSQEGPKDAD